MAQEKMKNVLSTWVRVKRLPEYQEFLDALVAIGARPWSANYPSDPIKEAIFHAVLRERAYQEAKWGEVDHDLSKWVDILIAELLEAARATSLENVLREILQVIAVGFACLEQHGIVEREEME